MMRTISAILICASAALAQPTTISVTGPMSDPFGAPYNGQVSIALVQQSAVGGAYQILSQPKSYQVVNGAFSPALSLVPNALLTPAGTAYQFTFGNGSALYCIFPNTSPTSIATSGVCTTQNPGSVVAPVLLSSLAQGGATTGTVMYWNGSQWGPASGITTSDGSNLVLSGTLTATFPSGMSLPSTPCPASQIFQSTNVATGFDYMTYVCGVDTKWHQLMGSNGSMQEVFRTLILAQNRRTDTAGPLPMTIGNYPGPGNTVGGLVYNAPNQNFLIRDSNDSTNYSSLNIQCCFPGSYGKGAYIETFYTAPGATAETPGPLFLHLGEFVQGGGTGGNVPVLQKIGFGFGLSSGGAYYPAMVLPSGLAIGNDGTAATNAGYSQLSITAGSAQSTNPLLALKNNGGTIIASFDPTGALSIAGGSTTIYRCTVAGTLRVGQLTSVQGDCGTAVAVGLITN